MREFRWLGVRERSEPDEIQREIHIDAAARALGRYGVDQRRPPPGCECGDEQVLAHGEVIEQPDRLERSYQTRTRPAMDDAICFGMNAIVTAGDGQRLYVDQPVTMTLAF